MIFLDFYKAIYSTFDKKDNVAFQTDRNKFFLSELNKIATTDLDAKIKVTMASILFEGFYQHLYDTELKKSLLQVRLKRWEGHFGTPTVTFLVSYKLQIDYTKQLFDEFSYFGKDHFPWEINQDYDLAFDKANEVLIDPQSIKHVSAPKEREVMGIFTKTHNPFGGFTTAPCDPISQRFIENACTISKKEGCVLEIGAGFGAATLEAIAKGAIVFCNDINPENLAVVRKRLLEVDSSQGLSLSGDSNKLILIPGELPEELQCLPQNSFDAILICRVLHFLRGTNIEESLSLMTKLLKTGGKIYIVCETPFLKNWQRFIPEYQKRVESGEEWPGEITNPVDFESRGRAGSLPKFVHWITKEILERSIKRAGMSIEYSTYINREGQFPEDLLLPEYGKESVGAIGVKM